MGDLFDYLAWRGDLSLSQDPLNEVDGMILSELAYINFPRLGQDLSLNQAALSWKNKEPEDILPPGYKLRDPAYKLLDMAGASDRFGPIVVKNFVEEVSEEEESQFGALTYYHEGAPLFIGYQGTDLHCLGWKEDLGLSYLPFIPAQEKARAYLEAQIKEDPRPLVVGGHSKGGNLAIYAVAFAKEEVQDQVRLVYNYDGPGFQPGVLEEPGYKGILGKIRTIVPQESIIGLLLSRLEEPRAIYSKASGLDQHMGYTWEVEKNHFVSTWLSQEALDNQKKIQTLLDRLDLDQRQAFTDALFTLLGDSEEDLIVGTTSYNLSKVRDVISGFKNLDSQGREILGQIVKSLISL